MLDINKKVAVHRDPMAPTTPYSNSQFCKDYYLFLEGKRSRFLFFLFIRMLATVAPFGIAYLLASMIDFFTTYTAGDALRPFYTAVWGIGILGAMQVWLRFFAKFRLYTIAANMRKDLRVKAMAKLIDLELEWHEKEETGSKIQKINQGSQMIYECMHIFTNQGVEVLVGIVGSMILFAFLRWQYALIAIAYAAIYFLGEYYFSKRLSYWNDQLNRIKEKVSGKVHESASNLLTVKAMGLKKVFEDATASYEKEFYDVWLRTKKVSQLKAKTIKIFAAIGYAGFLFVLGIDTINGFITVGSIVMFGAYFNRVRGKLEVFSNNIDKWIEVKSGFGRFMTIIGQDVIARESGDLLEVPKRWKTITFDNVTFRYNNKDVLKDFNLTIHRNDKIGVVGRSGCGKSTLVKLILGLYQPQKGRVLIDGKDIMAYKHSSITDTIGVVLQDSEMFNMALVENITIATTGIDKKRLAKALTVAQLRELILKIPKGLHTPIGEKGYKLSGGERQRVGIARAVYKDASFLILDEATSNLDSKTEDAIQKNIDRSMKDKTLLIIAHRLSTLKDVDKVIFMERGKITEEGTYPQLVRKRGKFYQMHKLQGRKT